MLMFLYPALIFVVVFLLVMLVFRLATGSRASINQRLASLATMSSPAPDETLATLEENALPKAQAPKDRKTTSLLGNYQQKISKKLEKAHLLLRPREFILLSLGTAMIMILLLNSIFTDGPAGRMFITIIGGITGFLVPELYLGIREQRFRRLLSSGIGDMLTLMANYLRAGHSFNKAMEFVAREVSSPLSDELKKFNRDVLLGVGLAEALADLETRTNDEDLGLVITAILIHHQVGGNLAEVFDNINETIRERIRIKGEIRALTAQGRLTAIVIVLLPIALGLFLYSSNPEFLGVLFTEPLGRIMLALAVIGELAGILIIRKIIDIKV